MKESSSHTGVVHALSPARLPRRPETVTLLIDSIFAQLVRTRLKDGPTLSGRLRRALWLSLPMAPGPVLMSLLSLKAACAWWPPGCGT